MNKKTTIVIIISLGILIGGSVLSYQWQQKREETGKQIEERGVTKQIDELQKGIEGSKFAEEVIITIDKTEYKESETVKITVKNNSSKKTFIWTGFNCDLDVQRYKNDNWLGAMGVPFLCCPCGTMCEIPYPIFMIPGEVSEKEWDQTIVWCEDGVKKMKNALGKYRFALGYVEDRINCKDAESKLKCVSECKECKGGVAYSNEFTIKE